MSHRDDPLFQAIYDAFIDYVRSQGECELVALSLRAEIIDKVLNQGKTNPEKPQSGS